MATYIQIGSTVTVGAGGAAYVEFASIPSTYTDILIKLSTRSDNAGVYNGVQITLNGASVTGRRLGMENSATYSDTTPYPYSNAAGSTASTFANTEIYIPNYASTTTYKSISVDSVSENNASNNGMDFVAALYSANTAVSTVRVTPGASNFVQYTTASLYGISKS